jgi:hypothetical protein
MTTDTLSRRQLNRATLARQMLLAREKVSAVEAVERLCGMQAQEAKHPFAGLWTRAAGFRREDLHAALHKREIVRATLMRGTLHLMSARDFAAFRMTFHASLADSVRMLGDRAKGLDIDKVLPVARRLVTEEPRTFNELRRLLQEAFPKVNARALGFAVRTNLPLVMVPTQDRWAFPAVARFALAEAWLDEPLAAADTAGMALRYLASYGPATAADVQTWSGLRGMREVLDGVRSQLRVFADERGRELFDLPDAPRPDEDTAAPPRFLPQFDSLVLAHADRTRLVDDEHRSALATKNLRIPATFLWDGFVRGTWTVERKRSKATLRLAPFEPLPASAVAKLSTEGEALLRFVEEDATTFDVQA